MNDEFSLYDLEVIVEGDPSSFVCSHAVGIAFTVMGENIIFSQENKQFSLYAMSSLLPFLPARQRPTDKNDWMDSDNERIACPDPHCGARFFIKRKDSKTTFKHSEVTKAL